MEFVKEFDPSNEIHVKWYQDMIAVAETYTNKDIVKEVNKNPMNLEYKHDDLFEWPRIHMVLGAKYAKCVLNKTAWIPN